MQSAWLANVASIALAKPFVHGLCWSELTDAPNAVAATGLVTAGGVAKPALERFASIRTALAEGRSWVTPQ
jgi:hypothetical protein